jgi:hypothetical protein
MHLNAQLDVELVVVERSRAEHASKSRRGV